MTLLLLFFGGILVFLFGIWLRDTVFVVKIHKFLKSIFNNAEEEKETREKELREKLDHINKLYQEGLITKKVHEEKQTEIIAKF